MALAANWAVSGHLVDLRSLEWFIAFGMCILALLKLQDVESFSTMFLGYDLLARRWVPYEISARTCNLVAIRGVERPRRCRCAAHGRFRSSTCSVSN